MSRSSDRIAGASRGTNSLVFAMGHPRDVTAPVVYRIRSRNVGRLKNGARSIRG
jgi:hypothetical protein